MGGYRHSAVYPYPAAALFDLVADVESYPDFLPFWAAARIVGRAGDVLTVDQVVRVAVLEWRLTSTATLDRPRRLRIASTEAPFRTLEIVWTFVEEGPAACRVTLDASYSFRKVPQALTDRFMDKAIRRYARAFERRAHKMLG